MDKFTGSIVMFLLFGLRCIAPLVLTLLIGWAMNRRVDKWEAEEAARTNKIQPVFPGTVSTPIQQPGLTASVRCWVFRDCGRTDCPAYLNPDLLCWKIKSEENGRLPDKCLECAYYEVSKTTTGIPFAASA